MISKVLYIGTGGVGQRHIRNFSSLLPTSKHYVVRSRSLRSTITNTLELDTSRSIIDTHSLHVLDSLQEAKASAPDLVVIASPSSTHYEYYNHFRSIASGIYIEKPVHTRRDDLFDHQPEYAKTCVGFQLRYNKSVLGLKDIIQSHRYGQPVMVCMHVGDYLPEWHPYEDYRHSYAANASMGGGVVLSQIHELDLLYFLFGVVPRHHCSITGRVSSLEIDCEDSNSSFLSVSVGNRTVPVFLHQDFIQRPKRRFIDIVFTEGRCYVDLISNRYSVISHKHEPIHHDFSNVDRNTQFLDIASDFIAFLQSDGSTSRYYPTLDETLSIHKLAFTIVDSGTVS